MFKGSILSLDRSIDSELVLGKIPLEFSAGFEAILKKKLFFRIGMFQRGTLASGIGLSWNDFIVDYAFLNDGSLNGIEKNHLLSVSVSRSAVPSAVIVNPVAAVAVPEIVTSRLSAAPASAAACKSSVNVSDELFKVTFVGRV